MKISSVFLLNNHVLFGSENQLLDKVNYGYAETIFIIFNLY